MVSWKHDAPRDRGTGHVEVRGSLPHGLGEDPKYARLPGDTFPVVSSATSWTVVMKRWTCHLSRDATLSVV
jgi:hypothetical protein